MDLIHGAVSLDFYSVFYLILLYYQFVLSSFPMIVCRLISIINHIPPLFTISIHYPAMMNIKMHSKITENMSACGSLDGRYDDDISIDQIE